MRKLEKPAFHVTAAVNTPLDMLFKLEWEYDQCRSATKCAGDHPISLIFSALNFCLTADALGEWTLTANKRAMRAGEPGRDPEWLEDRIRSLPGQQMCTSIANATKHASFRDDHWPGGRARLDMLPGPVGGTDAQFLLMYQDDSGTDAVAIGIFEQLKNAWSNLLWEIEPNEDSHPSSA